MKDISRSHVHTIYKEARYSLFWINQSGDEPNLKSIYAPDNTLFLSGAHLLI